MSILRGVCLAVVLLIADRVSAQLSPLGDQVGKRPSAERLPLPELAPDTSPSGFSLPPVQDTKPDAASTAEPRIFVKAFRFRGNTVVSNQELEAIAAPFRDRAIGATDLEQLRHLLTRDYIDRGYINSGAILPKQVFKDGVVYYQIIEGELSEIRVRGTGRLRSDYVRERLELDAGPPLNDQTLQDRFQLLLTDPLVERMDGRLMPGAALGQSILDVNVTRAKPYRFSLSVDNHRPPSTGAEEARLDGRIWNLTGMGDSLSLSLAYGQDRLDIDTGFQLPVSRYDTLLGLQYANWKSSILEEPLDDLDIDNRYRSFEVTLYQPFYRTLNQRFVLGARLALRESRTTYLNGRPFPGPGDEDDGKSKVTALRLSQEWINSRVDQALSLRSTFSMGLKLFDATWHGDNQPDGNYFAWLGQLQYVRQVVGNGAQLRFRGDVQLADDVLLPLEQYAIGGVYSVRGYRTNEVVRDQGYSLSLEFHYPLFSRREPGAVPGVISVIPFMDYGAAWSKGEQKDARYLHGAGIGLAWSHPRFSAELYYAKNLRNAPDKPEYDLQDASLYFRFTAFIL